MAINYITKDNGIFDQKITQGLLTTILGIPQVELVNGGKSFTLTTISTSGLKDHTRNKGFNSGTYGNDKKVYTMGQDRDVEFYIDKQDVDETNQDLAVANISNVFITEHVQPEIDAYRFSTLAVGAGKTKEETITEENAYSAIKAAILPARKFGPQNLVAFVSTTVMDALERSKEFTRNITNQNVGQTALESRVTSLDGVLLVEVWDDTRFKTKYNFSDGYAATADAQDINILVVAKQAVIPIVKENTVFLFAPGEHSQGDGYLYQNRLYHDCFIKEQQKEGVSVSLAPKADPSGVTLNKTTATLAVGATETLSATVAPTDSTDKSVQFTSSDATVATVTPVQGKVTAIKAGTATITATTVNGKTATCEVTVTAASEG